MLKMKIFLILLIKLYFSAQIFALKPSPTELYPNERILVSPDNYYLYWKHDDVNIDFEINFKSSKWALFGLRTAEYSDVIVGWVNKDKTGHFSDRKLSRQNVLTIDSKQDWIPLNAFKKDNYTVLKFSRNIKLLCNNTNDLEDLDILNGNNTLVFMTGDLHNPNDDSIAFENVNEVQVSLLLNTNGPFNCPIIPPRPVLNSEPTGFYSNSIDLIEGVFRLYWNFTKTDIIAEIHCKTLGWVAFGFSPNGGMDKSDVVVGWISQGEANFTDRFIYGREVRIDANQDWKLLNSSEKNGATIFKFKRSIKLCDENDKTVEEGSPYVIYAFGLTDPAPGKDISYHLSNRGSKKINFISGADNKEIDLSSTEQLDFVISNVILPPIDTYYYCKGFQVPKNLTQKRHIIKVNSYFLKI